MPEAIETDRQFMKMAIDEAARSEAEDPKAHPKVGAVVVRDGQVLAKAHRLRGMHAEYVALERILPKETLAGATVYTTLEPCTERGPEKIPCCDRLKERKVARVVIGMLDPNPRIRGVGVRELEKVRIKVDTFPEDLRLQIEELNRDFIREHDASLRRDARRPPGEDDTVRLVAVEAAAETERDRNALRAFLQRAEVRLSTMHRIAGAFLSGAGLLFLLPVFFRDYPKELLGAIVTDIAALSIPSASALLALVGLLGIVMVVFSIFLILVYSLYLLVKDLTLFYFIGQSPGFSDDAFYPRFALTAIAFSPDESLRAKDQIIQSQNQPDIMAFTMPRSQGVPQVDVGKWESYGHLLYSPTRRPQDDDTPMQRRFRIALGQAGLVDRDLVHEVARMEASLVRHNLHLRRLVLRYAKALVLMVWTLIITFASTLLIQLAEKWPLVAPWKWYGVIGILAAWLYLTPGRVVKLPIDWIYEWANQNTSRTEHIAHDPELQQFEQRVAKYCKRAWVPLVIATILLAAAPYGQKLWAMIQPG